MKVGLVVETNKNRNLLAFDRGRPSIVSRSEIDRTGGIDAGLGAEGGYDVVENEDHLLGVSRGPRASRASNRCRASRLTNGSLGTPIERVADIDVDSFKRDFIGGRRPAIIGGLMDGWAGYGRWTPEYFAETHGDDEVQLRIFDSRGGLKCGTESAQLGAYLARFAAPTWPNPKRPPYLSEWDCFKQHPELEHDFTIPEYFPNWFDRLPQRMRRNVPYRFVLIGPAGAVYNLHADFYGTAAWIAQFHGRKRFVLYPPEEAENLGWGGVDPDNPDLERYPEFADARGRLEGVLHPGEIVYIPPGWYHQVTLLDDSVSLVCNGVTRSNVRNFLRYCKVNRVEARRMFLSIVGVRRRSYYLG